MAHSEGWLLVGVTAAGPIGVDIERRRPLRQIDWLAAQAFSPSEVATFRALPPSARMDAFYKGWTCKEAFLKLSGEGLAVPLDTFDVAIAPDVEARVTLPDGGHGRAGGWTMLHTRPYPGYDAAACVAVRSLRVTAWLLEAHQLDGVLT